MSKHSGKPQVNQSGLALNGLWDAVHQATAGEYQLLGELGRSRHGRVSYLAQELASNDLVVVELSPTVSGGEEFSGAIIRELDPLVPASGSTCPNCGAPFVGWSRFCLQCGIDVSGVAAGTGPGATSADLLEAAKRAARGRYRILGQLTRRDGGGSVYFARTLADGRLVALRLRSVGTAAREGERYTLDVIQSIEPPPANLSPLDRPGSPTGGSVASQKSKGITRLLSVTRASTSLSGGERFEATDTPQAEQGALGKVCPNCGTTYESSVWFCPRDGSTLRPQQRAEDLVGQILADRYRVLRKLGEGGMGHVYLAEHVKMRRLCAVKVLRRALLRDADAIERFTREAANAGQIHHPNVAAVYDFGETRDGLVYLVMEYVDGMPLTTLLEQRGPLPVQQAVRIACRVADGLSAAHQLGIVHRDLKPDNIIVGPPGADGSECVKVVDFGIAKVFQNDEQQVTRTGFIVGTPAYMSPEQLNAQRLDGRSDIYSLGLVTFHMLTGKLAFPGTTPQEAMRRLTDEPLTLKKASGGVRWPSKLQSVIDRALARDVADRYQTAAEFRQELERVVTARNRALRWVLLALGVILLGALAAALLSL